MIFVFRETHCRHFTCPSGHIYLV